MQEKFSLLHFTYCLKKEEINKKQIIETFKEADVFPQFMQLSKDEQNEIIKDILVQKTEERQIKKIIEHTDKLFK
jgi:hypothetical protein